MGFSIIIPVNNEEELLDAKVKELVSYLDSKHRREPYEILISENGSIDRTFEIAKSLKKKFRQVSVLRLPYPDVGKAIVDGIKNAKYEKVFWFPIDFKNEISFIDAALGDLEDYDIILASKNLGVDTRPFRKRLANRVYNILVQLIFHLGRSDVEGYKAWRKSSIKGIVDKVTFGGHLFDLEILVAAKQRGLKMKDIPFVLEEIRESRYTNTFKKLLRATKNSFIAFYVIKKRKLTGYYMRD